MQVIIRFNDGVVQVDADSIDEALDKLFLTLEEIDSALLINELGEVVDKVGFYA